MIKTTFKIFILFFLLCAETYGLPINQNFLITSGKDAFIASGDSLHRSIFYFEVPQTYAGKIYVRIFDADIGNDFDSWEQDSEVLYRLFGKGGVNRDVRSITDALSDEKALSQLKLARSRYYNNQWRTITVSEVNQGEPQGTMAHFQLVVDGIKGQASNKYQVFISSEDKKNTPIEGARLYTPVINLNIPPDPGKMTQARFMIPKDAHFIDISNFDLDTIKYDAKLYFSTKFRAPIALKASQNSETSTTKVEISEEERGLPGAILFTSKEPNNIQLWIDDDQGNSVPIELPPFMASINHLPEPRISVTPLSECNAIILDATQSEDSDNDELTFQWLFEDGSSKAGSRIVQQFEKAGEYQVTLVVTDDSGFVAASSRMTQTIRINNRPQAHINAPLKGMPMQMLEFDAAESADADGEIIKYLWNFGDGHKKAGAKVKHRFERSGRYKVSLTVEDNSQSLCSRAKAIHKIWINASPVTQLNMQAIAAIDEQVPIDAQGSIDSDGQISNYQWYFGDGEMAMGKNVTHHWRKPGKYTVQLCVTDNAGLDNSVINEEAEIIINAPPEPLIKARAVIAADENVEFDASGSVDSDGQITQYHWEMGDGTSKQGVKINHAYALPGVYLPRLTVIDDSGVSNDTVATEMSVRVNHPPVPQPGDDRIVNTSVVQFDASTSADKDDDIIAYSWNFGDNQKAEGVKTSHVYAMPGKYTVTLAVTDASKTISAKQSDTTAITVNHPPVADAGPDITIPSGAKADFDAGFSEDPDGEIVSYNWLIDGVSKDGRQTEHQFDNYGQYQVRLTVKDNDGAENIDYATITVNAPPVAEFYPIKRIAPEQTVVFDAGGSYDPDGRITHTQWDFGDGTAAKEGITAKHAYLKPGRYNVTLTVRDDSEASDNVTAKTGTVEVNYPPQADAGPNIRTCRQMVVFDGSSSSDADGDHLNLHWDFGDETSGKGVKVEHLYAKPGIYPVALIVNDGTGLNNSVAYAKISVHINAPPSAVIKVNSPIVCAADLVLFDASKSADPEKGVLRYEWNLGDGVTAQGVNPVRAFKKGGDYKIELTVYDDTDLPCNFTKSSMMLHVVDAPIAEAGEDRNVCANTLVNFDGTRSYGGGRRIKSYEWDFGDGAAGVGAEIKHAYAHPGTYPARLIITTDGVGDCKNKSEDEVIVTVSQAPAALFTVAEQGCLDTPSVFNAEDSVAGDAAIVSYKWNFGDKADATGQKVSHQYKTPGVYEVKLHIKTDSKQECNTAELIKTVRINAIPQAVIQTAVGEENFTANDKYKLNVNTLIRFSGEASQDTDGYIKEYLWDFGDGHTQNGFSGSHQYKKAGDYQVTLQVTDNSKTSCNTHTAKLLAQVIDLPQIAIQGPETGCVGIPLELAIPEADESVQWFGGHKPTLPNAQTGADVPQSSLNIDTLTGKQISKTALLISWGKPGKYQIQARWGDTLSLTKEVLIMALPAMQLPQTVETYPGDRVIITPVYNRLLNNYLGAAPLIFQWLMGDETILDTEKASHIYEKAGTYAVEFTVSRKDGPDCLKDVYQLSVIVHDPPQATITVLNHNGKATIYTGGARDRARFSVAIKNGKGKWNYTWDFGDGQKAMGPEVAHKYVKPGAYDVVLKLTDALKRTPQTFQFVEKISVVRRK
ncbi:PKD domain-containing protein [Desulfococcaceae bacterium HSG7]|nr:PKD domain-containing protein [Desulfococcaceae bacterium HSG7]